jgi:hypothetical protein|tara:strand:+ start:193 stop:492 length:300 start_codon:yes stop_codon:yes gene_type:complete
MPIAKDSIIDSIMQITSTEELREIANALHQHRTYMNAQATRKYVVGDEVEFDGRRGQVVKGIVKRVKIKNIIVEEHTHLNGMGRGGRWNVSASLLRKIA